MESKIYRYMDPRTGECEYASPADIDEIKAFLMAWKFYWVGPSSEDGEPLHERWTWITSDERRNWLAMFRDDLRDQLIDTRPPEEVPALEASRER